MGKGLSRRSQPEEAHKSLLGLKMADLLTLPEPLSGVLNWMMRQEAVTIADVAAFLAQDEECTRALLADLHARGFVRETEIHGLRHYRVRLAPTRGRTLPSNLWQALDEKVEQGREEQE